LAQQDNCLYPLKKEGTASILLALAPSAQADGWLQALQE
jgi:hypothetical protein